MTTPTPPRRPQTRWPATAVAWISGIFAAGSGLLAVGHAGVALPLLSALGPGGDRPVPVAAGLFAFAAVGFIVVLLGSVRLRPWAWPLGLLVFGLTLLAAAFPYRGAGSALGIAGALLAIAILVSRAGRETLVDAGERQASGVEANR